MTDMLWKNAIREVADDEIEDMRGDPKFRRWVEAIDAAIEQGDYTYDQEKRLYTFWNCYVDPA